MTEMLNQLLQGSNVNNNGTQALDPPVPVNNQDIILGGFYVPGDESVSNTVEKFNIVEGKSTQLPKLNHPQVSSPSCIYNEVIITGSYFYYNWYLFKQRF
ncbi:Hypothetical predicted protein [Paramuricea clavata]|uniref:Uncharacterized protein n=1 Tax=Paramuricea clavata TaxID=317549 RepID=A0A6S7JIX7_PARCT|nr:Hypothetical predicted protein [Paramuricea clavata]